jgi:hypothetical protein
MQFDALDSLHCTVCPDGKFPPRLGPYIKLHNNFHASKIHLIFNCALKYRVSNIELALK